MRRNPWERRAAEAGAFALALLVVPGRATARAQGASGSLTVAEVLELHRSGVSDHQILRAANAYCIAFSVTDSMAQALTAAGMATELVDGLRAACAAPITRPALPAGVLVDDEIASTSGIRAFLAADGLCRAALERTGMRIDNARKRGGCVIDYPTDSIVGAVRIELTVGELIGGKEAQVVLGFGRTVGTWDQYTFTVTAAGHVELCRSSATDCHTLASRVVPGLIRAGPEVENVLAVEIHDGAIALFVNDERVGDYLPDVPVRGGIALGVGPASTVVFRRLRVRSLETAAAR